MSLDRDTTIVITKFNNLSETVLKNYCKKFGQIIRFYLRPAGSSRNKEAHAFVKFADSSIVQSILSNRVHVIHGTHVNIRDYQPEPSSPIIPSLMSQNPNVPTQMSYEQVLKENQLLKQEIDALKKALEETHIYSQTAYNTNKTLQGEFETERILNKKLKADYDLMVESYEKRLKDVIETSTNNIVKEEPIDCVEHTRKKDNYSIEIQVMKDRLNKAQTELGQYQTENEILNAKLLARDQQFDQTYKQLNEKYSRLKQKHQYISSCIDEFRSKVNLEKSIQSVTDSNQNVDNNDIIEIVMQDDCTSSTD